MAPSSQELGPPAKPGRFNKVEQAIYKAENRAASTGSGGNTENAIRQNIRSILDKGAPGFTAAERAAMEKIVRGGKVQNFARLVGKLSPEGNGLMTALGIGGAAANPALAAAPIMGFASKRLSETMANKNVQNLLNIIASGGQLPPLQQLSGPKAEALQLLLRTVAQEAIPMMQPRTAP